MNGQMHLAVGVAGHQVRGPLRWMNLRHTSGETLTITRDALGMVRGVLVALPIAAALWLGIALAVLHG